MRLVLSLLGLLFLSPALFASEYVFDYTPGCAAAYKAYMSLHLAEGTALVQQEMRANPYNLIPTMLGNYEDCLLIVLNGDKQDFSQRRPNLDQRLDLISKGPTSSPWHRYCKAQIHMQWAMAYIRTGDNIRAALAFKRSYSLARENAKRFPSFAPNNIILGIEEAAAGTIPDDYKWLASIFGLKGSVKKGIARFSQFLKNASPSDPFYDEALILSFYLRFYLDGAQQEVWKQIDDPSFKLQGNLMHALVKANLGLNSRHATAARDVLIAARADKAYEQFPILDYELGAALQLLLSPDAATWFNRYLTRTRGKYYIKETWQKLAYCYYLSGNMPKARFCLGKVKTEGSTATDADKSALRFATAGVFPQLNVLQARLLFDGGNYTEAQKRLESVRPESFSSVSDRLEHSFRLARVLDELGQTSRALQYYRQTLSAGRSRPEQFAARSALHIGLLYERLHRREEALAAFNDCLSIRHHDFQSSIDQQAKAGINRLTQ